MKLYYSKGACSQVPHIIINELGLPCQFISVDLQNKKTQTGENFLNITPKGAVPALELDNGEVLTENIAIEQYLADSHDAMHLLPPVGSFKRYRVLEWLSFASTDLHKGFGPLFNPQVPESQKQEIFIPALSKRFDYVDQHLSNHEYLIGKEYTLPDAYVFVLQGWLKAVKIDRTQWKNLARHYDAIKARPAVQKTLKEEGLL